MLQTWSNSWYDSSMKAEAIEHILADGTRIVIRSLTRSDAAAAVACLADSLASTPFLAMEPEEWTTTEEQESTFLEEILTHEKKCMLGAFVSEQLIGMADFSPVSTRMRLKHRAMCGISIIEEYQNKKIGRYMMNYLLSLAKCVGFEQMELQVASTNHRAIQLYKRLSFKKYGVFEQGMKHKDGRYCDLDLMIARL
ncbi:MAG: GNAT family N-acetyltransferase [Spirochaetia bacterium]|nr:GNAT family N-acetyltransferase [Spirochaetia bacterium]